MNTTRSRGRPAHHDILTPAEWRVAEGVRHGLTNRAIAERLGVSADAVKFHVANALAKLAMTSRLELRRWNGVSVDSNLAHQTEAQEELALGSLGQIARSVKNLDSAVAWYRDVLRLPLLYQFEKLAFFDCDGTRLMLSEDAAGNSSILYFRVPDILAAHRELSERGVDFVAAPHMIHRHPDGVEEWMAFFNDNERRPLGLMARVTGNMEMDNG